MSKTIYDREIREKLESLKEINTGFDWIVMNWKLKEIKMNKEWFWSLCVDFIQNFEFEGLNYNIAVVLDPDNYNKNIRNILSQMDSQQQEIFKSAEDYIADIEKVHAGYAKDSKMFWTFSFYGSVCEFKDKMTADKVRFSLGTDAVDHFTKHFDSMYKTALVLDQA